MTLERLDHTFSLLEAKGIKTSPNTEAELLETHLGIKFPVKPHKAFLTARNQLALIHSEPNLTKKLIAATMALRRHTHMVRGFYDAKLFTYFCKPDSSTNDGLHENMHAYTDLTNTQIQQEIADQIELLTHPDITNATNNEPNPEIMIAYLAFHEGIAIWGETETALNLGKNEKSEANRQQKFLLTGNRDPNDEDAISKFITNNFRNLGYAINYYYKAQQNNKVITIKYLTDAQKLSEHSRYIVGYYFVYLTMDKLLNQGLNINQSLNLLIHHPPQTLEELAGPTNFVTKLNLQ